MNKSSLSAAADVPGNHGVWPATATTFAIAVIIAPFAYAQFGSAGPVIVCVFTFAIAFSIWCATWGAAKLASSHPSLAAFFASSGVRMIGPIIVALAVVLSQGRIAPLETVYYVVPLYLGALIADVFAWVCELGELRRRQVSSGVESSAGRVEAR